MKKIYTGLFIALMSAVVASLSGCGGSYNAERMYWHTARKHRAALSNPSKAGDKEIREAIASLQKVIAAYPGWSKSSEIQFAIGQLYLMRKDNENAKTALNKVYVNFPDKPELGARSMFIMGNVYEREGNWKKALEFYQQVFDKYSGSLVGLQVPLYIARHYQQQGQQQESESAYASAINKYTSLYEANPYGKQIPILQSLIIAAYGNQGKWKDAVGVLEKMVEKYPKSDGAPLALYRMALISREVLHLPEQAMAIYRRIISEYPDTKMGKQSQLETGALAASQGDMPLAREEFGKVIDKYSEDASICAMAQLAIAAGYEKADNWEDAQREYTKLQTMYPTSVEALQVPLLIAQHYYRLKQPDNFINSLNVGIKAYQQLIESRPGKKTEAVIYDYIAAAYSMQNKWQEAINTLNALRTNYPNDPRAAFALLRIGVIYQEGFKDSARAKEVYLRFIQEYPEHNMVSVARSMIDKMQGKSSIQ